RRRDGARARLGGARRPHQSRYATKLGRAALARIGMRRVGIIRPGLLEGRTGVHPDAPFALYRL
ncbi:MAG TPA: hypothetical protein VFR46_08960, partial [Actinomycetes bacterium]|nr:hypothetical protein [Actinomycetes bacterium]